MANGALTLQRQIQLQRSPQAYQQFLQSGGLAGEKGRGEVAVAKARAEFEARPEVQTFRKQQQEQKETQKFLENKIKQLTETRDALRKAAAPGRAGTLKREEANIVKQAEKFISLYEDIR